MGWLREKYTRSYFTGTDEDGNYVPAAEGFEAYQIGEARDFDKHLLAWLDFSGRRVLDIGFGRGEMMKYAKDHGAFHVVGVDFSQAAYDLAQELFDKFNVDAEIYCDDVLNFVNRSINQDDIPKFDVVLMFDVIEHVPRQELSEVLINLRHMLNDKAVIIINTPVFAVDNDVIKDGLDPRAMDTSDKYDNTQGMHCNRYTKQSLQDYMAPLGYMPISGHYFVYNLSLPSIIAGSHIAWAIAKVMGYPLKLERLWQKEQFEFAGIMSSSEPQAEPIKPMGWKSVIKYALKPLGLEIRRIPVPVEPVMSSPTSTPHWITIKSGRLAGIELYLDPNSPAYWQSEMAEGGYDQKIFDLIEDQLAHISEQKTTIWDIGAHLGFHSLALAKIIEGKGQVLAFEPNPHSRKRFEMNIERNAGLAQSIQLYPNAFSDFDGVAQFRFSPDIDYGKSCGSHLVDSQMSHTSEVFSHFDQMPVDVAQVDTFIKENHLLPPALLKIDVEGAEVELLMGAEHLLRTSQPILMLEIHSTVNMFRAQRFLIELGYELEVVDNDHMSPERCFIMATASK